MVMSAGTLNPSMTLKSTRSKQRPCFPILEKSSVLATWSIYIFKQQTNILIIIILTQEQLTTPSIYMHDRINFARSQSNLTIISANARRRWGASARRESRITLIIWCVGGMVAARQRGRFTFCRKTAMDLIIESDARSIGRSTTNSWTSFPSSTSSNNQYNYL